jgi:hypothetical protein
MTAGKWSRCWATEDSTARDSVTTRSAGQGRHSGRSAPGGWQVSKQVVCSNN